jgi:6-phosphofructokinase 1
VWTTPTLAALFEAESKNAYRVRTAILGHLQQGGSPTGLDRINATLLSDAAVHYLLKQLESIEQVEQVEEVVSFCVGFKKGKVEATTLSDMENEMDFVNRRPKYQWWLRMMKTFEVLALSEPGN